MIEKQGLLFFVLPRWIVYTHWAPKALDVRDVGCRAILAHQLYTDKVGAMETLVPLCSPGFVTDQCVSIHCFIFATATVLFLFRFDAK